MTREKAIFIQRTIQENLHKTYKDFPFRDELIPLMKESCDMAIKALEQEPKAEYEVCNYTIQNDLVVDGCRHKSVASTFSFFKECTEYKFCPCCGRRIKIESEE